MKHEAEVRKCIHDLRGELNSLMMQSELLKLKVGTGGALHDLADAVVGHGRKASEQISLLSDLLSRSGGSDQAPGSGPQ